MRQLKENHKDKSGRQLAAVTVAIARDFKAEDIVVLDVRERAGFTDFFVIMTGRSTRHVQGLAEAIEGELRSKRVSAKHSEGLQEGQWVLLDFGDIVVHIFYKESRGFYDLEGLWHDAPRIQDEQLVAENQ
jgi:ribosome-associated protein